ncbi:GDSL-type esterase/lipase family protein [Guptibacillus algicola]|uniref:GDSL-type esterase/lipase family protein n=1 Tax=Guptibacillus algicola TaxID=225844 RepID=UPI001CD76BD9|nr:GDSL-type esterase/lipase family protein [Alkalihalobacillus algicola]MCA0988278.1 GDSL-type esterase/lipase family protein [Alkalihalobacillus algicola]
MHTYSAIGDSLTLGTGTILFSPTFPDYYRTGIEQTVGKRVNLQKYARNGATTGDVRSWLEQSLPIALGDIITITAGGNDLIDAAEEFALTNNEAALQEALMSSCSNMKWIVEYLVKIANEKPQMIRFVNLYNPYPDLHFAEEWIKKFNKNLISCTKNEDVEVADVFNLFKGREGCLLSFDGIHPNECGQFLIAEALIKTGVCL